MPLPDFVHLHAHTDYSFQDGVMTVDGMLKKAMDDGMKAAAITDHGNMHGALRFYAAARKAGIRPIIGCELYFTTRPEITGAEARQFTFHLTVLAMNRTGYRNLMRLSSYGYDNFAFKPRITQDLLARYSDGLVGMSACLGGEIAQTFLRGNPEEAERRARELENAFSGRFFYEIMRNGYPEQVQVNDFLVSLARRPEQLVATNDAHCLNREDMELRSMVAAIARNYDDSEGTGQIWYKTRAEMSEAFPDHPEWLENTLNVAEMCGNLELDLGRHVYPVYEPARGMTVDEEIEELAWQGLRKRRLNENPEYAGRLEHELSLIKSNGFSSYLLIVADFIRHAREKGIPVGPGRGSAAGSLVCYCLEITDIDPIRWDLLFERFINPERVSLPDIDVDFCERRRSEIVSYLMEKYGAEKVALIANISTLQARQALRDIGRSLKNNRTEMSQSDINALAAVIPQGPKSGDNVIMELYKSGAFDKAIANREFVDKCVRMAARAEGLARNPSVHAAGIVIADRDIHDYCPTFSTSDLRGSDERRVITQYDKKDVENGAGLIKIDLLGLRNITVIDLAIRNIAKTTGRKIGMRNLPVDDPEVFRLYSSGDMAGIFQMESAGMRKYLRMMKPACFEDVIALIALYRPGPINSGMVDSFVRRKNGDEEVDYFGLDKFLEPVLKSTYGVIVYQEQVMAIARNMSGFTLGQADILRRAMGKKNKKEMASQQEAFINGALENGIAEESARHIFDMIAGFAEYGFNKSHAAAYAFISYQTAWLKVHYPVEYMAALMEMEKNDVAKLGEYVMEARKYCEVMPPDIRYSERDFSISDGKIFFGLSGVKNVSAKALDAFFEMRKIWRDEGWPCSITEMFAEHPAFDARFLDAMNNAGAFDSIIDGNENRALVFANRDEILAQARKMRKQEQKRGDTPLLIMSKKAKVDPVLGISGEVVNAKWSNIELLGREKDATGVYITNSHPIYDYIPKNMEIENRTCIGDIIEKGKISSCYAIVMQAAERKVKKTGKAMMTGVLEDETGSMPFVCFPETYASIRADIEKHGEDDIFVPGACVNVGGTIVENRYGEGEGQLQLQMESAIPFYGHENTGKYVYIRAPADMMSDRAYDALYDLIERHKYDPKKGGFSKMLAIELDGCWVPGESRVVAWSSSLLDEIGDFEKNVASGYFMRRKNAAGPRQ